MARRHVSRAAPGGNVGKVVAFTMVSLDGVMQAPGRADEDTRGGFAHGGWAAPYAAMMHAGGQGGAGRALLFGRRTYLDFHAVWPKRRASPFSAILDAAPKFVASRTLRDPLPWQNSTLLVGEAADTVARLKSADSRNFVVMGSGDLCQSLMRAGLLDEYILLIHPLVLGSGRRLFPDDGPPQALELRESKVTPNGVFIGTYVPAPRSR